MYPASQAPQLLRLYDALTRQAPDALGVSEFLCSKRLI